LNIEAAMPPSPSATRSSYDVVVIGSGVGGYTAATYVIFSDIEGKLDVLARCVDEVLAQGLSSQVIDKL
jgi:glycine/D-amino acid oxidase-like deaminating enzyme